MQLTKGAIGNLINRYKAVLKKCHLMNTFGSLAVAGMLVMGGAGMATAADDMALGGGSLEWSGDADHLMGGNLYKGNVTVPEVTTPGDISLSIKGGTIEEIIGGSYVSGNNDQVGNVTLGNISTTIQDGSSTEFVVGGSKISNDVDATLATGKTSLTINGGTFGKEGENDGYELVMGGNYVKTGTDTKNTASAEGSRVTVNDGTFHASVVGGSVAHRYNGNNSIMVEDNGSTSVVINGGTFSPSQSNLADSKGGINLSAAVIGGGLAYGANTNSVLGSKEAPVTSSVTINDGTINGKIVAGSAAVNGSTAMIHGNSQLTVSGGTLNNDLIGGSFAENAYVPQEGYSLNITGDTGVSMSAGTLDGEVIGGSYLRANGTGKVANSSVAISGGRQAAQDNKKAQYVIGGNKAMAYSGSTTTVVVEETSSVSISGKDTLVADGAVLGGGLAKATDTGKATSTVNNSLVSVKDGTLAGVIGGGMAETYSIKEGGFAKSEVTGASSVAISGGTINQIQFGAVDANDGALDAAIVGGGMANDANSTATVGSTNVTISAGTILGKVVAGGAAVNGGSSTVTNDTSLTMTGGKVDGDLIGGGFVDMNNATDNVANVGGSTYITVSDGSLVDAEIIGGGSVRNATGEANVKGSTHVTVTKYDNQRVDQQWVQYVLGGGKAMTSGQQTATANVTGSTNVTIGEQGATGEALKIEFGTVAGGGLARAQAVNSTAKAEVANANVTVHSGILSGVAGGGIAESYSNGTADATVTGAANLTINGGTINGVKYKDVDTDKVKVAVLGGGIAKGSKATADATTTNTVINGGTIKGHVVAGGLADGGIATVGTATMGTANVTNANLTINGGEINGSVYAGGAALGGGTATVEKFDVRITGGTINGDVVAGNYTGEPATEASLMALLDPRNSGSSGSISFSGGTVTGNVVVQNDVIANVIIDGTGATVTGSYQGNANSTLTFQNYNTDFNKVATGFGTLEAAAGSNVRMDNLSTGAKGTPDTSNPNADKGFFGDGSNVTVNGKGTVTATNVTATGGKTITVADGGTLDAGKLTTTAEGGTAGTVKTEGLGSTLIIGNAQDALDSIDNDSLSSTVGSEIKFTGLGESVAASTITGKLQEGSTGIVNVGDTKVNGLAAQDGKVAYTTWSASGLSGITNDELKKATLTEIDSAFTGTGSFGSAELSRNTLNVGIGGSSGPTPGNLTLTGLDGNAFFAMKANGEVADASVAKDSSLTLGDNAYAASKSIGKVTLGKDATLGVLGAGWDVATVNSGAISATGDRTTVNATNVTLNVAGHIGAAGSAIGTITADAANIKATGDVTAGGITLAKGGSVTSDKNITVNSSIENADGTLQAGEDITAMDLKQAAGGKLTVVADGTIEAAGITATNVVAKALTTTGDVAVDGGILSLTSTEAAASTVESLKLTNGTQAVIEGSLKLNGTPNKTLTVGTGDDTVGGTTLSAKHIDLNDGMLIVDPDWGLASSNVAVESMGTPPTGTTPATYDDVVLNGDVGVGQNSYLALGIKDTGWLPGVVAGYTKGVGLSKDGVTAALGVYKGLTIDTGKALLVDGSKVGDSDGTPPYDAGSLEEYLTDPANDNSATFAANSLLVVNGQNIYGDTAAISFENNAGTLKVDKDAKLLVTDAVAGQDYTIVANVTTVQDGTSTAIATGGTVWKTEGLSTTTDMISLGDAVFTPGTGATTGKVTTSAERNDAHTVFPNLSDGMANAVNDLYTGHDGAAGEPRWDYADVNSADMGVRFLSRATDNRFLGADKDAAASTIESAARIAFAGAVPQMTKMASDAGTNAVVNRLGFANPADGAQAMDAEGKIVDRNTTGFALWIAPLWQSQHGWGMDADSMDYGFNGNLGGVSLGADYTFENAIRAGITFNIGGGYAESSGGDLNSTENRMSFWGLGAYAGWNYENFGLMADVSYTSTWNDLQQDMDSRMGMGDLEADVQASAISAGLRAEYKLETSVLDVIPHIGVRYMSLNTWGFDAESNGGTVLEGDGFHQDIWTFPVGVTFTKDFTLDSGWSFKPSIDFSVIPAAGDIKAKQDVAFTGLPGSYEVETQMMDYLTWQGGVGLEMGNDTMSFGVNYTLQAGQHTTGHGVFGSFRYEF